MMKEKLFGKTLIELQELIVEVMPSHANGNKWRYTDIFIFTFSEQSHTFAYAV